MLLTIFTPTFNRAGTIPRTYQSLKMQSCMDFEWLIVDDGSTDETERIISLWKQENMLFPIRYVKQKNGGKHRAYNNGLQNARGELFFCVDSDDWLPLDSVEKIKSYNEKLKKDNLLAGVIGLKEYPDKRTIGKAFYGNMERASMYELELLGQQGERSIVFKTKIARQYPFPEETDEKFLPESVVYDRYENRYQFLVSNDTLTICEYQQNGLSSHPHTLMRLNPAGYKLYFSHRIDMTPSFVKRITYVLQYQAFRRMYNGELYEYNGKHKVLVKLLTPLGFIVEQYYKRGL